MTSKKTKSKKKLWMSFLFTRLYVQGASKKCIGLYHARWLGWVTIALLPCLSYASECERVNVNNAGGVSALYCYYDGQNRGNLKYNVSSGAFSGAWDISIASLGDNRRNGVTYIMTNDQSTEYPKQKLHATWSSSGWINAGLGLPDTPPTAWSVTFGGTLRVGAQLTGNYYYSDTDSDPESGSTFKWYASASSGGTSKTAISGATSKNFTLTASEVGKYISFEVTPKNARASGSVAESAINATPVADATPPAVTSITVKDTPAANDTSMQFTVTFDENANAITSDDFTVATLSGTAAGTVSAVSAVTGSSIDVTVSSITGTGTIRLDLNANTDIVDDSDNGNNNNGYAAAYSTGAAHTVDCDDPVFETSTPSLSSISASGAVINGDLNEEGTVYYVIVANGAVPPTVTEVKNGTGSSGTGEFAAGHFGTTDTTGSATINTLSDGTDYDVYVVAEDGTPNVQDNVKLLNLTTLETSPEVTSITLSGTPAASAASVDFNVVFADDVTNVTADDFNPLLISGGTNTAPAITSISGSGGNYTVTVNTGVTFGDLRLDLNADTDIVDESSNVPAAFSTGVVHSIATNHAPTVSEESNSVGPFAIDEDIKTALDLSDLLIADTDVDLITVTIGIDNGLLFAIDGNTTVDSTTIAGSNVSGTTSITLTGLSADINIFLDDASRLEFQTAQDDITSVTLTIATTDSLESSTPFTETITINAINDAPTISGTPVTSIVDGNAYSFTPTANDIESDTPLLFSITNQPTWANFNSATGALTGNPTPSNVGTTTGIVIRVEDPSNDGSDLAAFNLQVIASNSAPVISEGATTAVTMSEEGSPTPFILTLNASDADANTLTWSINNQASHGIATASGTGNSKTISYAPNSNYWGNDSFVVKVSDSTVSDTITVNVTVSSVNDLPNFTSTAGIKATEEIGYSYSVFVSDQDDASLTISAATKPSWLTITDNGNGTATLSGTPTNADVGNNSVVLQVIDDEAGSDTQSFTIVVSNTNDAPVITGTPATTVAEDAAYSFTPTVVDADSGDTKTFSISNKPAWATFNTTTGALTGTPDRKSAGEFPNIIITVSDAASASDALPAFTIEVTNSNQPPVAENVSLTVKEDAQLSFTMPFSDADGDPLTYQVTAAEHGVLSNQGEQWQYTPAENFNGADTILVVANDGDTDSQQAIISITIEPVNDTPIAQDDQLSFAQTATNQYLLAVLDNDSDIDADSLTIIGASAAIGSVSVVDNQLLYLAEQGFIGTVYLEYLVDDGQLGKDKANVSLTITGVLTESAPVITLPDDVEVNATGLFTKVEFGVATAIDYSGNPVAVSLVDGKTMFAPGVHKAYWQAIDSKGNKSVVTQNILVHPLVSLSKDQTVVEGNKVEVKVILNGNSPSYPVVVPFSVSGSAVNGEDHDLVAGEVSIGNSNQAVLSFSVLTDNELEESETIQISLSDTVNASQQASQTITISEGNVAPEVELLVEQGQQQRLLLSQDGGDVVISAQVSDANEQDGHSYQWASSNDALQARLSNDDVASISIAVDTLAVGVYPISITVTDNGEPVKSTRAEVYLEVTPSLPVLTAADSDGDLIPDSQEGYGDQDKDGIPDYQDAITACNVAPEEVSQQLSFLVEGEAGVCLRKGASSAGNESGGSLLNDQDLASSIGNDTEAVNVGGIFDYIAYGLPQAGQEYRIVLPQRLPIPANAVYRKYSQTAGWTEYVKDASNALFSSPGNRGYCPPPQDASWHTGLNEGDWCVQLMLNDGGPNDNDGLVNGTIVDPGGVSVYLSSNNIPTAKNTTQNVLWNSPLIIDVVDMISDEDGDSLTISNVSADFGKVSIIDGLQISYMPATDFVGNDTLVYSISDGNGGTASGTVTVKVSANSVPVAVDDSASTDDRTAILVDVLANDSDADNDQLTLTSASAALGVVSIIENKLNYTPPTGLNDVDTVSYTFSDGNGGVASATLTVTVKAYQLVVVDNKSKSGGAISIWMLLLTPLFMLRKKKRSCRAAVAG